MVLLTEPAMECWMVESGVVANLVSLLSFEQKGWKGLALAWAQDSNLAFLQSYNVAIKIKEVDWL